MFSAFYPSADGHIHLRPETPGADQGGGAGELYPCDHVDRHDPAGHGERGTAHRSAGGIPLLCGEFSNCLFYGQRQFPRYRADYSRRIETPDSQPDAGELWTEGLK